MDLLLRLIPGKGTPDILIQSVCGGTYESVFLNAPDDSGSTSAGVDPLLSPVNHHLKA